MSFLFGDDYLSDYKISEIEWYRGEIRDILDKIENIRNDYINYDDNSALYDKITDLLIDYKAYR